MNRNEKRGTLLKFVAIFVLALLLLVPLCLIIAVLLVRLNDFLKGLN